MTTLRRSVPSIAGDLGTPGGGDGEDRHQPRHGHPEPRLVPPLPPRGLVDVGRGGGPHMPPKLLDRGLQLGGALPLQPGDHPDGDRQAQQVGHQLADRSLAQAIGPGQDAEDGPQPRAERPRGHAWRQSGTGGNAAVEGRSGGGVGTRRRPARTGGNSATWCRSGSGSSPWSSWPHPAVRRLALDDLTELFGRNQGTSMMAMTGLPAPLPARGGGRRPALDRGRVGRGGLGGVGRVLVEPFLQVGDPPLQGAHQGEDSRLRVGRERIPEVLWEWWSIRHATVVAISGRKRNSGP